MLLFSFPMRLLQKRYNSAAASQDRISNSDQSIAPSSHVWRNRITGVAAAVVVAFVLQPVISAMSEAVLSDHSNSIRSLISIGVFGLTFALVQRAPTSRSALGRGLLFLGTSLILTPTSLSVMLVLQLQDWATMSTDTVVQQTGSVVAFLFGGVFIANALLIGLVSGAVFLLIGRLLARRTSSAG